MYSESFIGFFFFGHYSLCLCLFTLKLENRWWNTITNSFEICRTRTFDSIDQLCWKCKLLKNSQKRKGTLWCVVSKSGLHSIHTEPCFSPRICSVHPVVYHLDRGKVYIPYRFYHPKLDHLHETEACQRISNKLLQKPIGDLVWMVAS